MPYVDRDERGKVVAKYAMPQREWQEYLSDQHPDIIAMDVAFEKRQNEKFIKAELLKIDLDSIRAIREWIATHPDNNPVASTKLAEKEAEAILKRSELSKGG